MNNEKYTQKSLEALQDSHNIAIENSNSQIEQAHLLYALLKSENSLAVSLFNSLGVDIQSIKNTVLTEISGSPKISGGDVYISQALSAALVEAEKTAHAMRDEYISVEHLLLGLIKKPDIFTKRLFGEYNINENK
ncbi:MAG: type VI secretion system ATPase TssH, partial [Clostridia bacterium]|nr:type VI secretion system ATPase TssH [Clostridia bacterium]